MALFNAMLNVIITEGLANQAYIEAHTEDFAALAEHVAALTPEDATAARVRQRALEQLQGELAFRRSLPLGSGESAQDEAKERLRAALYATVDAMLDDFLAEVRSQHGEVLASWQRAMAQHAAPEQ